MIIAVIDKCKTEKTKCSHFCSYNYTRLDFVCSCPSELVLSENKKDCRRISKCTVYIGHSFDFKNIYFNLILFNYF